MTDTSVLRESSIRRITILCQQRGAINLSQGFSDQDTSEELRSLAVQAITAGNNQYTDPRGAPVLRRALAAKLRDRNQIAADPDRNIVVTCGATEGMMVCFESLLAPGDRVLTFTPMYENYYLQAVQSGIVLDTVEMHEPDFLFDYDELKKCITPRTKAILVCNPCNPTGKVFSRQELAQIARLAAEYNLLIFSDETYEYFTWDGRQHTSIGALPECRDRTATVISMGKTYSVTGWRVGYVVGHPSLIDKVAISHDFHTVTAPHPFQVALAGALSLPESYHQRLHSEYCSRKQILTDSLREAGFGVCEPQGAYFLWCEYGALSRQPDTVFCEELLLRSGIAAVPGSVFFPGEGRARHRLRFTFSKCAATIDQAAQRLKLLV